MRPPSAPVVCCVLLLFWLPLPLLVPHLQLTT